MLSHLSYSSSPVSAPMMVPCMLTMHVRWYCRKRVTLLPWGDILCITLHAGHHLYSFHYRFLPYIFYFNTCSNSSNFYSSKSTNYLCIVIVIDVYPLFNDETYLHYTPQLCNSVNKSYFKGNHLWYWDLDSNYMR